MNITDTHWYRSMTLEDLTALNSICNDLSRLVIADYFADKDMTWVERELRNPVPSNESDAVVNGGYGDFSDVGSGCVGSGSVGSGCVGSGGSGSVGSGGGGDGFYIDISFQRFLL